MRLVTLLITLLVAVVVNAQEYKPYPRARITQDQWQQYFEEVSSKHAASRLELPTELLVVFENTSAHTSYAFTQTGHPAHPAWVTRQVVQDGVGVYVQQIGYFAGDEEPFAKLFRAYQELNAKMRENFQRQSREGK